MNNENEKTKGAGCPDCTALAARVEELENFLAKDKCENCDRPWAQLTVRQKNEAGQAEEFKLCHFCADQMERAQMRERMEQMTGGGEGRLYTPGGGGGLVIPGGGE